MLTGDQEPRPAPINLGPSARRLQNAPSSGTSASKSDKASTTYEQTNTNRFFKGTFSLYPPNLSTQGFRLRRRSSSKAGRALLSRSMTAATSPEAPVVPPHHHRSAGNIHALAVAPSKGKPRNVKRGAGKHATFPAVEVFRDECGLPSSRSLEPPMAPIGAGETRYRRSRSASGSATRLASFWSFLSGGSGGGGGGNSFGTEAAPKNRFLCAGESVTVSA